MKKFISSKFFIVILCVALALVIVPSVLSLMGLSDYVRSAVVTVFSPIEGVMTDITNAITGFTDYFTEYDRLKEENEQLRERIAELEDKYYKIEEIEDTNKWLYEYLNIKRQHTDYDFVMAEIVGREVGNYMTVFTLNVGGDNGVTVDMPVITSDGIVGYVTEAGSNWSKVQTVIESASSVGACVERSGELGLLNGDYSLRNEGLCKLIHLASDSDVCEGDRIISSGLGSIYPRGLVIGIVERTEYDDVSRSVVAYVRPSADLENISRVMVIRSYETVSE